MLLFAMTLQNATPDAAPPAPTGDDIVVTARRGHCQLRIADRIVADAEFQRRAAEWAAGRPVRVIVPASSSYRCMARIMFRLSDHGVHHAVFVDG